MRAALLDHTLSIVQRQEIPTLSEQGLDTTLDRMKELVQQILPTIPTRTSPGSASPRRAGLSEYRRAGCAAEFAGLAQRAAGRDFAVRVRLSDLSGQRRQRRRAGGDGARWARGFRHVIFMTISTGIGSGMICDGRLLLGNDGLASEAGHMIRSSAIRSAAGKRGSGSGAGATGARPDSEGREVDHQRPVQWQFSGLLRQTVGKAAREGDALALLIVERAGGWSAWVW